ncbi:hypothetical protein CSKR_114117 [Clonorchis sinensis]|uniref:Uncharacterized protein n=1 Tax=Clonorchis sinensis TaxID=79923 RepID=A0A8T1MCQ2_CLOSI|nr:hypothetical protein CSKR_114117 [Clonorchis sinensis]
MPPPREIFIRTPRSERLTIVRPKGSSPFLRTPSDVIHNRFSLVQKLARPVPRKSVIRRPTKVPEGFVIPNLSHRNYRKLNWGLSNLNLPRITLPSAIHRAVSMTSSQLRWRLKPVVSETDLERLTHEYRQSGALPFCHENTPFVTSRTTTFSVQQRIHKLTRSPVIFLNDKDYMQNLKYDILREQAEKCGEAFEAGDVHPQQFFPNYRPKLKKKTVPTEQLIQLISPGLPMPYVFDKDTQATPSKAEKPLRKKGSIGYFRVRGPSKSPHIGITVDTKELGGSAVDKAVNDIYLRAQESPEPVSMLMERIFPNNSQIGTLYALAEKALQTAVEGSVDRYKMRSATPISKAASEARRKRPIQRPSLKQKSVPKLRNSIQSQLPWTASQ